MTFEMYGLQWVDTGVSALIENMAIVHNYTIYAAVLSKRMPKVKTMVCAGLAVAGVGFLSLAQSHLEGGGLGILLVSLAAMTYAALHSHNGKVSQEADLSRSVLGSSER